MASSITASSLLGASFQAGGLSSSLDTNGIIDKLVEIEGRPLTQIATQQATLGVQVSALGSLITNLNGLSSAASALSTGVSVINASGTYSDFTLTGSASYTGRYTLKVQDLARAAKARSTTLYTSADDVVNVGATSLQLSVDGTTHSIAVPANTKLGDLASLINNAGKPFTASIVSDGSQYYLTVTNKNTGYAIGAAASSALTVVQDVGLGLASPVDLQAKNAVVYSDGLRIERKTNTLTDVIPGATLSLKAASNTDTDVVFANDTTATAAKLQTFVDAYNTVAKFVHDQLVPSTIDSSKSDQKLSGTVALAVQRRLGDFISTEINTTGQIRTLRDLGVRLQKDGTVALNQNILNAAVAADPAAVNAVFGKATTGLSATVAAYVTQQTNKTTGVLVTRQNSLNANITRLTARSADVQRHLDTYREQLVKQYTAMESLVGQFKSIGNYLTSQENANNK